MDLANLDEASVDQIRRTYSVVKNLKDEKKSISEDIGEEKKDCAKKTGLQVKQINGVLKILESREKGEYNEDYILAAQKIEESMHRSYDKSNESEE